MKLLVLLAIFVVEVATSAPGSYGGNAADIDDGMGGGGYGLWLILAFLVAGYAVVLFMKAAGLGGWGDADWGQVAGMGPVFAVALFLVVQVLMFSIVMWPIAIIVAWVAYGRWKGGTKSN